MKLLLTEDGSHTIYSEQFDEIYHSNRGAITESEHVYIQAGLASVGLKEVHIFEVGFGTGLNAFLSWIYAEEHGMKIHYTGIELYPVSADVLAEANYTSLMPGHESKFDTLNRAEWEKEVKLSEDFTLKKVKCSLLEFYTLDCNYNIIYFDAFSPEKQSDMWSAEVFQRMYDMLAVGGVLVTYCSKGYVRRHMQAAGFTVGKLPGPPGKHEMVRAVKTK